jgi:hypothetical protein
LQSWDFPFDSARALTSVLDFFSAMIHTSFHSDDNPIHADSYVYRSSSVEHRPVVIFANL